MTTVVLDLDGVVYRGHEPVTGAGAALTRLMGRHRVLFATNNSRRTRTDAAAHITAMTGVPVDPAAVVTSAVAAARVVAPLPTAVVGGPGIREALAERGVPVVDDEEAEQVVTGIDRTFDFERMRTVADALRRGAVWVATNTDAAFPVEGGGLIPGAGAIVAALATASGRTPTVAGKPHPPMVEALAALVDGDRVVVVGDRAETDLALARAGGWAGVLVLSGVTPDAAAVPEELRPEAVLPSIAELPDWLEAGSHGPGGVA